MEAIQMQWVVLVIGALVVSESVIILIKPVVYRKLIKFLSYGRMLYIPEARGIVVGVLFMRYALDCRQPWMIIVFGLIAAIKGLVIFVSKPKTFKDMLNWLGERSDTTLRLFGILELAVGVWIVYGGMPQ